jgi:hypothetical protein
MTDHDKFVGVATAISMLHAMLIDELDKRGSLSKSEFAALLLSSAKSAEDNAPEHLRGRPRLDLQILRNVVANLDLPSPPKWNPVVIDGDKA